MLYNPLLETFIAVADMGSFAKASEKLYISPTAIMKQMNALEDQLGVKLLQRTPMGVQLTSAGESIYKDAKFLIDYSQKAINSAKESEQQFEKTFCVGTSLLNPAKPFMDIWYDMMMGGNERFKDYKIHLVPFDDDKENILQVISKFGELFDFVVGVCDSKQWLQLANFKQLGTYKKMVAVSRSHPLAKKSVLTIDDFKGQTLLMVKEGDSPVNDEIRKYLLKSIPDIHIEDVGQYYDLAVYNRCAEGKELLLTVECWKEVHPGITTIPVEWDFEIPYGLLYSLNPPEDIAEFVESV
ncbi:MAG: LysR family transcriptional regulator [Bacillota bacterium]|nr:LysR family transcriptional regulator [Bacillota bacterium]